MQVMLRHHSLTFLYTRLTFFVIFHFFRVIHLVNKTKYHHPYKMQKARPIFNRPRLFLSNHVAQAISRCGM
jgi:hypothetical protein